MDIMKQQLTMRFNAANAAKKKKKKKDSSDDDIVEQDIVGEDAGDPEVKEEVEEIKQDSKLTSKLQEEAVSASHKLIHIPKNPFCEACQRGKMRERYSRRGAFKQPRKMG